MKILAIETSCDDTALAIADFDKKSSDFKILSSAVSSQIEIHKKWGGVYPTLARREHQKNLTIVLKKVLKDANLLKSKKINISLNSIEKILEREQTLLPKLKSFLKQYQKPDIDCIAVTYGPGLEPCLWTGVNFARALSLIWKIPIIPINHIEGHLFANFLSVPKRFNTIKFPAIFLIVSGGHTQLILVKKLGDYKIIGETRDDAAGEAFDKIARVIGLPYPGGPAISQAAKESKKNFISLPRPMINSKDFDFSFSGLKTAVLYDARKRKLTKSYTRAMAHESQQAIIDVLAKKTLSVAIKLNAKTIILGGGVAANKKLQELVAKKVFESKKHFDLLIPDVKLCTDNAQMIALTACYYLSKNAKIRNWKSIKAEANLTIG